MFESQSDCNPVACVDRAEVSCFAVRLEVHCKEPGTGKRSISRRLEISTVSAPFHSKMVLERLALDSSEDNLG